MNVNSIDKNSQDVIKEIYKINVKLRVLEGNFESYLGNNRNISSDVLTKYLSDIRNNSKSRLDDYEKLKKRVFNIRKKTDQFKSLVENIQPNDNYVHSVREIMEDIESILIEFKQDQKSIYENLLRSEISLWQECLFMEKKIDSWSTQPLESDPIDVKKKSSKCMEPNNCPSNPITAFEKFVTETGGKTGGWSIIDHETFMRVRRKHCGIKLTNHDIDKPRDENAFLADVGSLLAPKSAREIREHEIWFQRFQQLLAEKKIAIGAWRTEKSKQMTRDAAQINDELTVEKQRKSNWNFNKTQLEERRQALDNWRTERALEEERLKLEKETAAKLESEKKKRELEQERKEMRQQVEEYKQRKRAEESEKKELEIISKELEKEEKKKQLEIDSARINERNVRMIEEKIIKQHRKEFEKQQQIERLEDLRNQVSVTARRDPSRLLRPTSVWTHRLSSLENGDNTSTCSGSSATRISNVQHKAVPTWRRDI